MKHDAVDTWPAPAIRDKRGGSHATTRLPPTSGASTCVVGAHRSCGQPGTASQCWC
jgi:hypothetical protein